LIAAPAPPTRRGRLNFVFLVPRFILLHFFSNAYLKT
jgi:hypothetical protein